MLPVRIILILLALMLSGCASLLGAAAAPGAGIGTTVLSGKTPVDHLYSAISGKDCSIIRNRQGLTYCVEDERVPPVRVVCYRTLGDVSCYDQPNPFNDRQRAIVEDAGVTLVPFVAPNPIPPQLLPGPLQQTEPADAVEYQEVPPAETPDAAGSLPPVAVPLEGTPS